MKIRIATWNIAGARRMLSAKKFDYSDGEDLKYFAEQLSQLNLDIICIQESHVNDSDSLAKRLGAYLGMPHVAETPGCPSHIDPDYRLNTAIISKLPYTSEHTYLLPRPTFELRFVHSGKTVQPYDRYLQTISFQDFEIANIHTEPLRAFGLTYKSGVGSQLAAEIDSLLVEKLGEPLIIAADLNIGSPQKALGKCTEKFSLHESLPDQATQPDGWGPDHILFSPEWKVLDSGIIHTQSDHFLCWSELELM